MRGLTLLLRRPLGGWLLSALLLLAQQGAWLHALDHARGLPNERVAAVQGAQGGTGADQPSAQPADACKLCLAYGACLALAAALFAWHLLPVWALGRVAPAARALRAAAPLPYRSRAPPGLLLA